MTSQNLGPVGQQLTQLIQAKLNPIALIVDDQSAAHAGHSGARPEGETHFHVDVTSQAFVGLTRLAQQRLVLDCAAGLMKTRIHALSIKTRKPG